VRARLLVAVPTAIVASLVLAASASAVNIGEGAEVTTNADDGGITPGCQLRDAIAAVSTDTNVGGCTLTDPSGLADQVTFAPGMSGQTITLNGNALNVNDTEADLAIFGPGMNQLTISGNDASRVFQVSTFTFISGLSVVHGACCSVVSAQGGAIFATARLDLTDVKVADSAASITKTSDAFAVGGGIYTTDRLNLNQSIVTGNSAAATTTGTGAGDDAEASGGGIFLNPPDASVSMDDTTISDNTADAETDGDNTSIANATAGIAGDQIELDQSTVSGNVANSAENNGGTSNARGALYVNGIGSASHLDDSTIAGNQADNTGGPGILAGGLDLKNETTIRGSTIALNGPIDTGDTIDGANILEEGPGGTEVENTIIADPRGLGDNCSGTVSSVGFNDEFPLGTSCFSSSATGDRSDDPLLATGGLAPNGGLTETIALQPTSPVIDQGLGANLSDPTVDQRGFTRPVDFSGLADAAGGDASDIGAFEVQQACTGFTQPTPSTPCPTTEGGGGATTPQAILAGHSGKLKGSSVGIPISCPAGGPVCQGTVSLTGNVLLAVISKKTKIGSASFSIRAGQKQKVKVRLSKRAIKTIKTKGKLVAKLTITTQGDTGPRTSSGKFKIKR
jgi:hypothetical protein